MNPEINAWADRHSLSPLAMQELAAIFGIWLRHEPCQVEDGSESAVQRGVRLAAARSGYLVWRNNVGALKDERGRIVRYGLANESKRENDNIKSSDLVGIKPGGQFWCRECKPLGWQYTATEREVAQLRFIQLVTNLGGDAAFSTGAI